MDLPSKWAVSLKCPGFQIGLGVKDWIEDGSLPHLWLLLLAWRCPGYWPQHSLTSLVDDGIRTTFSTDAAASWCGIYDQSATRHALPKHCPLTCVSVTVRTLGEGQHAQDFSFAGRTQYVRDQLAHIGACIAGLQETRSSRDECALSGSFIRLCSGPCLHA